MYLIFGIFSEVSYFFERVIMRLKEKCIISTCTYFVKGSLNADIHITYLEFGPQEARKLAWKSKTSRYTPHDYNDD